MSCSSGRVEVGYEGDTCSFTCNTGYEPTLRPFRVMEVGIVQFLYVEKVQGCFNMYFTLYQDTM